MSPKIPFVNLTLKLFETFLPLKLFQTNHTFNFIQRYSLTNPFRSLNPSFLENLTSFDGDTTLTETLDDELNLDMDVHVDLPIHAYEDQIKETIRANRCVVLTGSTGCGKVINCTILKTLSKICYHFYVFRRRSFPSSSSKIASNEARMSTS